MRLFIAVLLSDSALAALARAQGQIKAAGGQGRFTPPQNLHLTLAFLGECESAQPAGQAIEATAFAPFPLELGELGRFKRPEGDILYAGLKPCDALQVLHRELSANLRRAGFALDSRPYAPHLTLARKLRWPPGIPLPAPDWGDAARFEAPGLSLMRSTLTPTGPVYEELLFRK